MDDVAALRLDYREAPLDEADLGEDPIAAVQRWLAQAVAAKLREPNAMTLSTVGGDGRPSARTVLLKGFDQRGVVFYSNRESRKGREIAGNPHVALVLLWLPLERQVCMTGAAAPVPDEESDAYFASRPRGSQLGAWASQQSQPAASRAALDEALAEVTARFEGRDVPRPPHWGGYRVELAAAELWQGRADRLHDRFRFTHSGGVWQRERLQP